MKVWITSGRNSALLCALFFACVTPCTAFASVDFTEIMYDAPGADTGREWIEITNLGTTSVDLTGYKLFESDVNHGLTLTQGTTTLLAGESAIIASDPQKFLTDYPGYTAALFKSPFNLTNTAGSFALKDKTLKLITGVSYTSAQGAAGDGNSLHLSQGAWIPGAPNPGSSAPSKPLVKSAPVIAASASSNKTSPSASTIKTPTTIKKSKLTGPVLQNISPIYMYILGAVAFVILVAGAILYAKPVIAKAPVETESGSEEFELE